MGRDFSKTVKFCLAQRIAILPNKYETHMELYRTHYTNTLGLCRRLTSQSIVPNSHFEMYIGNTDTANC